MVSAFIGCRLALQAHLLMAARYYLNTVDLNFALAKLLYTVGNSKSSSISIHLKILFSSARSS